MTKSIDHKFSVRTRFTRSARLQDGSNAGDFLDGFALHGSAREILHRVSNQISEASDRAFTWTGPYGTGKSTLALYLSALVSSDEKLRSRAKKFLEQGTSDQQGFNFQVGDKGWIVVRVVGQRSDPAASIADSLRQAVQSHWKRQSKKRDSLLDGAVADQLEAVAALATKEGGGLLLLVDEMGKFLEHAVRTGADLFVFQEIAENFARSDSRCALIGILHQSFSEYSVGLDRASREEWEKIQGRFIDIPFTVSLGETLSLIGQAIEGPPAPPIAGAEAKSVADAVPESQTELADLLTECWPLEPFAALMLAAMSRERFAQNDRSVFSFLCSNEPNGFRDFLKSGGKSTYSADRLWDYLQVNLEPSIMASGLAHKWAEAAEAVSRTRRDCGEQSVLAVKIIALAELFGRSYQLSATAHLLSAVLGSKFKSLIADLCDRSILVHRRHSGTWGIFAGSDVDIDAEVERAQVQISRDVTVVEEVIGTQSPIVAKRHYHETGTLRWFEPRLVFSSHLEKTVSDWQPRGSESGAFLLVLPETGEKFELVQELCKKFSSQAFKSGHALIIGLARSACEIVPLAEEMVALQRLPAAVPALEGDPVARRELSGRTDITRVTLASAIQSATKNAHWYIFGEKAKTSTGTPLSTIASIVSDQLFSSAPPVFNELINREKPSSQAIAARRVLMYRMVENGNIKNLGIEGYPPEAALFLSMLSSTGLHDRRGRSGTLEFLKPHKNHPFAALWRAADEILTGAQEEKVALSEIFSKWQKAPFGLKPGAIPIFALAYILSNEDVLGFYLDGRFTPVLDDYVVDRMLQRQNKIELRRFPISKVRQAALSDIAKYMEDGPQTKSMQTALGLAKPLVSFTHRLHPWVHKTARLSPTTRKVRDALLRASDPYPLLFQDLPEALGIPPIKEAGAASFQEIGKKLNAAVEELRGSYQTMLDGIATALWDAIGENSQATLKKRCSLVIGKSGDMRLDAFARRLASAARSDEDLEGLASLVANKPPRDWTDSDIDNAHVEINELARRFTRIERFSLSRSPDEPEALTLSAVVGDAGGLFELDHSVILNPKDRKAAEKTANSIFNQLSDRGLTKEGMLVAVGRLLDKIEREKFTDSRKSGHAKPAKTDRIIQ